MAVNEFALHCTVARHGTVALDVNIAKSVGFSALELSATKLHKYFDAGYSREDLKGLLGGLSVPGLGYLRDIERTGALHAQLMEEAQQLFSMAVAAGAKGVQVLTGPIDVQAVIDHHDRRPSSKYAGLLGLELEEQKRITARNLRALADLAAQFNLTLYLEALAWTPLTGVTNQIQLIDRVDRPNVKMVIDFWHCYASGDTPDTVARMDKHYLYGVHVCDSLTFDGGIPNEDILRDVPTGEGVLDLKAWIQAVKATGYQGWWSCELFCLKQHQADSFEVARNHFKLLNELVNG
ncbi:sugar phosphate isomerase/epimerase family protein [Pseudomonas citrulli]|uniref:Sugar phosphate isomerase/epimerase family protein n=1 Tax=Pseudomonas citrulli TaxID=3064347 RepID=A0ABT9BYE2_9PSED|nr:sugar phosphate isomerase/epimerase family protein [Pseudomonas sp. K18]MDO7897527.1 sugar phosphate isomerase/epimerase family protein [Pseudomonas sp. K18]